ncbi:MAG: carboxypeptidase-like regulatory domain-containing protein [Muribaculaceae bacterium]|nr:carboxypeptidase-like regulatory domain-containing protein [Muribaculaceae bacterium]
MTPIFDPDFDNAHIKAPDGDCEIWLDGDFKGMGEWKGNLAPGTYTAEIRKPGYESWTQEFVVEDTRDKQSAPGREMTADELARIVNPQEQAQGHWYVDLGLPSGTLWSVTNIGAERPWDFGDYYAWGEIETKEMYSDSNSKTIKNPRYDYIAGRKKKMLPKPSMGTAGDCPPTPNSQSSSMSAVGNG